MVSCNWRYHPPSTVNLILLCKLVINQHFYYYDDGILGSRNEVGAPDYRLDKMLYQALTRAREEIIIVIYKSKLLLDACLNILGR